MDNQAYKIIRRADGRFIVCEPETESVLDNAQGYGYTTRQKAAKAAWYKFKGGKDKLAAAKLEAKQFWHAHKEFATAVSDVLETWFKEIALGEIDADTEISDMATRMGIEGFNPKFLEHLS